MPPSKSKKQSRSSSGSKVPHAGSDQTATSPWTPKPTVTGTELLGEEELMRTLEEASTSYPGLIGKTALIGRLTGEVKQEARGCKLWLSEASMGASSISPGSLVSVSLASSRRCFSSRTPLSSLMEDCARHFGFSSDDKMVNEVGTYFVLATVFPSCKLQKDEVRLSSNLSCAMGYPASGRITFVYPIDCQLKVGPENGNAKLQRAAVSSISLYNCKDLNLALVASKGGVTINSVASNQIESPTAKNQGQVEKGNISSPKTPFPRSKTSSPSGSQLTSPRYTGSPSNTYVPFQSTFKPFDIREVLQDESGKKVLQTCASSLLCSRHLLCGNIVMIPILSELCIFQVVSATQISEDISIQNLTGEDNRGLFRQTPDILRHVNDAFLIDRGTKVHLFSPLSFELETPLKQGLRLQLENEDIRSDLRVNFSNLGGLSKEYSVLKDIIISSAVKGTFSSMGLRPTKGVLLHGPPGTGKTSLARLCAHDAGVKLFSVNGPEVISQYHGESEQALHDVFDSASQSAPAVVFIDELDAIAPSRKEGGDELSLRMVATLLNLMDGIGRTEGILVIAATNRPDSIEPAIRRPGRLDREIEIGSNSQENVRISSVQNYVRLVDSLNESNSSSGVPSPSQRHDILLNLLQEREHSLSDMEIHHLAISTHGFVGADLAALCNEAALVCLRRHISSCSESFLEGSFKLHNGLASSLTEPSGYLEDTEVLTGDNMESSSSSISELPVSCKILMGADGKDHRNCMQKENILSVTSTDFEKARMKVRPSAMREVILEVPKVSWDDVGGQKEVKLQLMEAVQWPQKHQDAFKRIGTRPPTGVLLFGPPGCSKTLLARAVASEAGLNFLAVKGPELFSKWVGESEKAVRSLFAKARANAPSIIFFDEIDGLAVIRGKESDGVSVSDRVMSQLLVELDGLHQRVNVTVIAATNRPDKIDSALLRPGRFDRLLYVGPPGESDRKDIFHVHLCKMPCSSDVCVEQLAVLTKGYTGADIYLICREAAIAAIEERLDASEITMEHLTSAVKQVQPSAVESYQELSAKFQRLVVSATSKDELVSQPCSSRSRWIPLWLTEVLSRLGFSNS